MKIRKKTIIYTVLVCVVMLVASYMYAHIDKMQVLYDDKIDTSAYVATGNVGEEIVEQTFLCKENSLDGMNVKCQLFGDVKGVSLEYQLFETDSDIVVAKGEISADKIKNNQFTKCFFDEKITGCNNKKYTLQIREANASAQQGIGFYYENQVKEGLKLIISGEEREGTLIAKTITKRFDFETFVVVVSFVIFIWAFFKVLYKLFK